MLPSSAEAPNFDWQLSVQAITVRIRWFGICVGYGLVNLIGGGATSNHSALNAILVLGGVYALLDTYHSRHHGKVFLSEWPLFVSLMEATFIGLLCYFDGGVLSAFRFYTSCRCSSAPSVTRPRSPGPHWDCTSSAMPRSPGDSPPATATNSPR